MASSMAQSLLISFHMFFVYLIMIFFVFTTMMVSWFHVTFENQDRVFHIGIFRICNENVCNYIKDFSGIHKNNSYSLVLANYFNRGSLFNIFMLNY